MRKKTLLVLSLIVFMVLSLSLLSYADDEATLMGTFAAPNDKNMKINEREYIPLDEVAETLNFNLEWNLKGGKVEGRFNYTPFDADNFIIYQGKLYLPADIIRLSFDMLIEVRGNRYYIYRFPKTSYNLQVELQTNADSYYRGDPIAVSLLVINRQERKIDVSYSSGQEFDLVLRRYGREVWRYSQGQAYITLMNRRVFNPREYQLYTLLVNPAENKYIPRGDYELVAEIPVAGSKITSNTVNIEIR